MERKPKITKPLSPLEKKVQELLLQVENESSYKSDHEVKREEDAKFTELLKSGKTTLDFNVDTSVQQTAHEYEEMSDKELMEFKNLPLKPKVLEKDNVKSIDRALGNHLILILNDKIGKKNQWMLPFGIRKNSETLRETAERVLNEKFGDKLQVLFLGNAPCGFYKYKYPKRIGNDALGAKIFFFKAVHISGNVESGKSGTLDYQWATREEMKKLLGPKKYRNRISRFLIDENDSN